MHLKDLCETGCSQDHSFHFVRLAVSSGRGPVSKQVQRRSKLLDLRVDLAERQVLFMVTGAAEVVLSACLISLQLALLFCSACCHWHWQVAPAAAAMLLAVNEASGCSSVHKCQLRCSNEASGCPE